MTVEIVGRINMIQTTNKLVTTPSQAEIDWWKSVVKVERNYRFEWVRHQVESALPFEPLAGLAAEPTDLPLLSHPTPELSAGNVTVESTGDWILYQQERLEWRALKLGVNALSAQDQRDLPLADVILLARFFNPLGYGLTDFYHTMPNETVIHQPLFLSLVAGRPRDQQTGALLEKLDEAHSTSDDAKRTLKLLKNGNKRRLVRELLQSARDYLNGLRHAADQKAL